MNKIYNKINNHELLNNSDIAHFIHIYSKGKVKTVFADNPENIIAFSYFPPHILVDKKIVFKRLKHLISLTGSKIRKSDSSNKSTFLVDLCNIYLLSNLFHELEHAKQYESVVKPLTNKTKILKSNIVFINLNPKLYKKNHDLYYHEYDAVINSLIKTLYVIKNKCDKLNKNAILEFNRIMAILIYHSYGNEYENDIVSKIYDKFESPISYTKYLSNCWDSTKERKILSICINNLKKESTSEYLKLINGFELSDLTLSLLYYTCTKEYFTDNLLEEIKRIDETDEKVK